ISCVNTSSAVSFRNAQVNYYVKGLQAGQLLKVYMLVNGRWVEQQVLEIREDHVIINQTATGPLAIYAVTLDGTPITTTAEEAAAFVAASAVSTAATTTDSAATTATTAE
ncbi:MAG: hypothetical protein Q4C60_04350, partial [Eubacteriales bacterium]|nr:hypothetical protein [Eubacteriales bacterium]